MHHKGSTPSSSKRGASKEEDNPGLKSSRRAYKNREGKLSPLRTELAQIEPKIMELKKGGPAHDDAELDRLTALWISKTAPALRRDVLQEWPVHSDAEDIVIDIISQAMARVSGYSICQQGLRQTKEFVAKTPTPIYDYVRSLIKPAVAGRRRALALVESWDEEKFEECFGQEDANSQLQNIDQVVEWLDEREYWNYHADRLYHKLVGCLPNQIKKNEAKLQVLKTIVEEAACKLAGEDLDGNNSTRQDLKLSDNAFAQEKHRILKVLKHILY